jgi:hypothetical protein
MYLKFPSENILTALNAENYTYPFPVVSLVAGIVIYIFVRSAIDGCPLMNLEAISKKKVGSVPLAGLEKENTEESAAYQ